MSHMQLPEQDLRADHEKYPLTIFKHPDARQLKFVILIETFHESYSQLVDFIVSIAEPISRPQYVHEYWLTDASLKAAVSLGITSEDVKTTLLRYSKYRYLPVELSKLLRSGSDEVISLYILNNNQYIVRLPLNFFKTIARNDPDFQRLRSMLKTIPNDEEDKIFDEFHRDTAVGRLLVETSTYRPIKKLINISNITEFRQLVNQHLEREYTVIEEAYVPCEFSKNLYTDFNGIYREYEPRRARRFDVYDDYIDYLEVHGQHNELVDEGVRGAFDAALAMRRRGTPASLQAYIKPTTVLRPYQYLSMYKVVLQREFGGKMYYKLYSGLIVLPCGSGKSLQGIATACAIGASCLVVTNGNLSSSQWKAQFLQFSTIEEKRIYMFNTDYQDHFWEATAIYREIFTPGAHTVLIATYNMLTNERPSRFAACTRYLIQSQIWGCILFDEAHGLFARSFKTMFRSDETTRNFLRSYSKILLTATPLREDRYLEENLNLIGSKLYESNWSDLAKQGFIATLRCAEVRCPISRDFYARYRAFFGASGSFGGGFGSNFGSASAGATAALQNDLYSYLARTSQRGREAVGYYTRARMRNEQTTKSDIRPNFASILPVMNPGKLKICSLLKNYHAHSGHYILIFCDNVICAQIYAKMLDIPFITGSCPQAEREAIVRAFLERQISCFMLSRVGDTSLDLPDANVLIEIDWYQGSRRQETQRIGRISRPKSSGGSGYFYILVSEETREVASAAERRSYLSVNQGYAYSAVSGHEIEVQCAQAGVTPDPQVQRVLSGNHDEFLLEMLVLSVQRNDPPKKTE